MHIVERHKKSCATTTGSRRCNCNPSFQARVKPNGRKSPPVTKTFPTRAAAKAWATEMESAKLRGLLPVVNSTETVRQAGERLVAEMRSGVARTRAGRPYKPGAITAYERDLRNRVYPAVGPIRLVDVKRANVQAIVDEMLAGGADPSTVQNAIKPLRVIYRRAIRAGAISVSPCDHLDVPAATGRRDRIATPDEAKELLAALRPADRALWATGFYAGLRRGEIAALRWEDIDFDSGLIRVNRSYDAVNRVFGDTKSEAGERRVPLIQDLRVLLVEHQLLTGRRSGLIFGVTESSAFTPTAVRSRALRDWKSAGLAPIKLHECRHTYASLLIASGVNRKELATYLGHAQVATSEDIYGHLFPGHEAQTAARLDAFLGTAG